MSDPTVSSDLPAAAAADSSDTSAAKGAATDPTPASGTRGLSISRGAATSFIVALLLLIAALYFYFVPIVFPGKDGTLFGCASAANPPTEPFPKSACLELPKINAYRAYALFASAILTAGLGALLFGVSLPKRDAHADDDFDDDDF